MARRPAALAVVQNGFYMLKFNGAWRYDAPASIPREVIDDFFRLIGKIAAQGDRQELLEHFKSYFAEATGAAPSRSSSASWAETDLQQYMWKAAENAPMFIEAFYDGCEALRQNTSIAPPDVKIVNRILSKHKISFEIRPPNLASRGEPMETVPVVRETPSVDDEVNERIQASLSESEKLLSEGRARPAVQEVLWLLETVSTAFQGLDTGSGTVQGKYFNKIVGDLRRHSQGTTLDQVLEWVTTLHGYLSSPTGGGIRHGTHLKAGVETRPHEARLFCNLIRSYIDFLLKEHRRLKKN
jgi:hypothetical protein